MVEKKVKHLWEINHPYYCNSENYYKKGLVNYYECWDGYQKMWNNNNIPMNLIFRFDAVLNRDNKTFRLQTYRIQQRLGIFRSEIVLAIPFQLEQEVITYLTPHMNMLKKMWEPINFTEEN